MLHGRHYQNAYVTRDIDAALARFADATGRDDLHSFEIEVEAATPEGVGPARLKLALFWIGGLQYELIQPISGMVHVYEEGLADDGRPRFHHAAAQVEDWEAFRADVGRSGLPVVREGSSGAGLRYVYVDRRPLVGHYVEYVWADPERWRAMGAPWLSQGDAE